MKPPLVWEGILLDDEKIEAIRTYPLGTVITIRLPYEDREMLFTQELCDYVEANAPKPRPN